MSEENVEILRPIYEEWARGNFAAGRDLLDAKLTYVTFTPEGEALTYHGAAQIAEFMRDFLAEWDDYRVMACEFVANSDRVMVRCYQTGRGRRSGVAVDLSYWTVWRFRAGKAVHLQDFRSRASALQAAGIGE